MAVTPVVIDGAVAALLPFAQAALARRLADAQAATVAFSDSRMALRGRTSCTAGVRVDVTADRDGSWTWTGALDQLVRKHPPPLTRSG